MESRGHYFRYAELQSPVLQVYGQDGHVCCQAFLMVCQFLLESKIARSSVYLYFLVCQLLKFRV